jgi:hypothetical protein
MAASLFNPRNRTARRFQLVRLFVIRNVYIVVGFEVFTAIVMKIFIFWDIAPCSPYMSRRFGGTYRLHLQGPK